MIMTVPDLAKNMRGYFEEIFVDAFDDRLIDLNPCPPKKNFAVPKRVTKHHGTIDRERLPELYNYLLSCNSSASFKACAVALVVSGLRVSNIALILQKNYDAKKGRFTIQMKTGEDDLDGLMKSGREYRGTFPDELRKTINDQMVKGHTYVFVSDYSGRQINPESSRKRFKGLNKSMTSHGLTTTMCQSSLPTGIAIMHWKAWTRHTNAMLPKKHSRHSSPLLCLYDHWRDP